MTQFDESCRALAAQGEILCGTGDFESGIAKYQKALELGTPSPPVLFTIYGKLGTACFHQKKHDEALESFLKALRLAEKPQDEAMAAGNVAITLESLGMFPDAIVYGKRQLALARAFTEEMKENAAVGRALYNLGNIHLAKAKAVIGSTRKCPPEAREDLDHAIGYYVEVHAKVKGLRDFGFRGRVCGNLGSARYLLGDFPRAIMNYVERQGLAVKCDDVQAERRAYTNLGNCHFFLGQFTVAEQHYLKALSLVDTAADLALEAQICYSLGNTYSLLNQHAEAIGYYDKQYQIAQDLHDPLGLSRASWRLGAMYAVLGQQERAVHFAKEHYRLAQELGDDVGAAFAQSDVNEYAGRAEGQPGLPEELTTLFDRISMHHMDLLRVSPDKIKLGKASLQSLPEPVSSTSRYPSGLVTPETKKVPSFENPKDMVARLQRKRLGENYLDPKLEQHELVGESVLMTPKKRPPLRKSSSFLGISPRHVKRLGDQLENRT